MDAASVETQGEYADEVVDATKKEIDGYSFDLANCPNVVNTVLKVAESECDLTDVAYLGAAGVVPPAAVVPSSATTRNPTLTQGKWPTRPRRWPLSATGWNQVTDLRPWETETH